MPSFQDFFVPCAAKMDPGLAAAIAKSEVPGLANEPRQDDLIQCLLQPERLRLAGSSEYPGLSGRPGAAKQAGTADPPNSRPLPELAISGLWLLAGDLERSHELSQKDDSAEGSFWHGVMHRREGDYSNAAYWFRRVGAHPVIRELGETYPNEYRDPYHFIDRVDRACHGRAEPGPLMAIQWTEWQLLMRDCLANGEPAA